MTTPLLTMLMETVKISLLVGVMMVAVDIINILTKKRLEAFFSRAQRSRQYILTSLLGTVPGCIGGFTNVSLYVHGFISFGALAGSMIAVSGDDAFVMIALFPHDAVLLFGILFIIGSASGWLIDRFMTRFRIQTCDHCSAMIVHQHEHSVMHYLSDHLYGHIVKKHLVRTAVWTFAALVIVDVALGTLHLEQFTTQYMVLFVIVAALVGLIPESGPHLIFVTLYAQGIIPFSVLLTSAIVQDGHGMLPMLSYSLSDSMKLKAFNLTIGLVVGLSLFSIGY